MYGKKHIKFFFSLFIVIVVGVGIMILASAAIKIFAQKDYWRAIADRLVNENVVIRPTRGNIISSDGKLMASSLPEYRIYMDFRAGGEVKDSLLMLHLSEIAEGLHRIFPDKSTADFKKTLLNGRKKKSQNWLLYKNRISYTQLKEVKKLPVLSLSAYKGGFHVEAFNQRKKPFGSLARRTLGDMYPDMTQGAKNGLELTYDSLLKGTNGIIHRQKVMNKYLSIVDKPAIDGFDLVTTIDVSIQDIAEKALLDKMKSLENAVEGVAIVMDVKSGDVLANVNMTMGQDGHFYEMRNLAVSNMMEPGSTFKTASVMVALEDGYITPNTIVSTGNGIVNMYGSNMKDWNWYKGGFGDITVTRAMEVSSNVGVSKLINEYYHNNPQKFVDGLKRMGLADRLDLGFVGQGYPSIKGPKERYFAKTTLPWMSIGYETQIPPIFVLNFYNSIANNGTMVKPRFVRALMKDGELVQEFPTEVVKEKICSERTLKQIQDILFSVVAHGTGKPAGSEQFHVSGKTGTAQISQGKAGYKSGGTRYLVSFCGFFPSEAPQYSCLVSIKLKGGYASGGAQAGGAFHEIAERIYAKHLFKEIASAKDSTSILIPSIKKGNITDAAFVLHQLQVRSNASDVLASGDRVWGIAECGLSSAEFKKITMSHNQTVPDVIGMGARDAVYLLQQKGLKVVLSGVGKVRSQSLHAGSTLRKGETIQLTLKN